MLQFSDSYFKEETIQGFTISKTMKHAWAAQLEVLRTIMEICEKQNLTCYAFWGTLLGAVRHQGFIPWDDDIDIAMKREDYIKFLQAAGRELPEEYCVLNAYTETEWPHFLTRVTNSHKIDTSRTRLNRFHGCPFVVGVDIFPLDYIPRDTDQAEQQKSLMGLIRDVLPLAEYLEKTQTGDHDSEEALEEGLSVLEECCGVSIDRSLSVRNQLLRLYDRLCMMYGEADGDLLTSFPEYIKGNGFFLRKEWFDTKRMQFENMMVTVPSGYDQVLTALFGGYMTPVRSASDHEYPFYGKQLQTLHEQKLWLDIQG